MIRFSQNESTLNSIFFLHLIPLTLKYSAVKGLACPYKMNSLGHAICLLGVNHFMMTLELFGAALFCFVIFYKAIDFFEKV